MTSGSVLLLFRNTRRIPPFYREHTYLGLIRCGSRARAPRLDEPEPFRQSQFLRLHLHMRKDFHPNPLWIRCLRLHLFYLNSALISYSLAGMD